jgi:hypothetical protein
VVHLHVVVLEAMGREHRRLDVGHRREVVALVPEHVHVARVVAVRDVHGAAGRRAERSAVHVRDRVGEVGRVVRVEADPALARVAVPIRDRRDRDDRLEPFDAGGRDAVRQRAVVGLADHGGVAAAPGGQHRVAVRRVEARDVPVEPLDHGLHPGDVARAAVQRAALRVAGPVHLREHVRVAPRHEVVVDEQRPLVVAAVAVGIADALALVAAADGRVVRARVDDRGNLQARTGLPGAHDLDGDPVETAVAVLVDPGLRDVDPLADRLLVVEHRRGRAVGPDGDHGFRRERRRAPREQR